MTCLYFIGNSMDVHPLRCCSLDQHSTLRLQLSGSSAVGLFGSRSGLGGRHDLDVIIG